VNPLDADRAHSDELSIVDSLVQLSFLIQSVLGRVGAQYDLSLIQIRLLGILRDREPGMMQLADYLKLDKSSITGLVDRAERRGFVVRQVAPDDRRGFRVKLTPAGRELVQTAGAAIEREIAAVAAAIDEAERAQLAALAARILNAAAGRTKA